MGSAWSKSCSHVRHSMGYTTTLNVVRETTNYNPCEWVVRKFASDLRNELISLFVGIRCFFSARLIRSAVGEVDGMPDGHCTSERLVTAWVAKRVIGSAGFVTGWVLSFMRFVTGLTWERDSDMISMSEDPCSGKPGERLRARFFPLSIPTFSEINIGLPKVVQNHTP